MTLQLKNLQRKIPVDLPSIRNHLTRILQHRNIKDFELSIVFVAPGRMRTLNREYLQHDYVTDVITFDLTDKPKSGSKYSTSLEGEIIICPAVAHQQAQKHLSSTGTEILLYSIHGILHLIGYNDKTKAQVLEMRKQEQKMLQLILG